MVSAVYIASVIIALETRNALEASWFIFAGFVVAVSVALIVYYRPTR
jgi:hypothetical protein